MITANTRILGKEAFSVAVQTAAKALERDIANTCVKTDIKGMDVVLRNSEEVDSECFVIKAEESDDGSGASKNLVISASDDLGLIYGIYHISKEFLGVNEFWFWNEQELGSKESYEIPKGYSFASRPFPVRFRGWFVNDEVLIDSWEIDGSKEKPWEMALERWYQGVRATIIQGYLLFRQRTPEASTEYIIMPPSMIFRRRRR